MLTRIRSVSGGFLGVGVQCFTYFFFFQAEDGIRDLTVTGVQTCALPILPGSRCRPAGTEMVMPGDNVSLVVELITPVAMDKGLRFAIREGGRTVGAGTVDRKSVV